MKIQDIITETSAGSIGAVAAPLGSGDPAASIYGKKKKKKKTEMIKRSATNEDVFLPFIGGSIVFSLILLYIATSGAWQWYKKNKYKSEVKRTIKRVIEEIKTDPKKREILDDLQHNYIKNGRFRPGMKNAGLKKIHDLLDGQPQDMIQQMVSSIKTTRTEK